MDSEGNEGTKKAMVPWKRKTFWGICFEQTG